MRRFLPGGTLLQNHLRGMPAETAGGWVVLTADPARASCGGGAHAAGSGHEVPCVRGGVCSKTTLNQERKVLPVMSLWYALLTKLRIVPAGKRKKYLESCHYFLTAGNEGKFGAVRQLN